MKKLLIVLILMTMFAGCAEVDMSAASSESNQTDADANTGVPFKDFTGEKGQFVAIENDGIQLEAAGVSDGQAHFFNTQLPDGETVYFFIVKSPDGNIRAAANGCQVCGSALQGFRQEGDQMVCNTCGNKYPLDKIATEKGGCNPAPISPSLTVSDGFVTITLAQLEGIKQYFH